MKSRSELRLECARMAAAMATAKTIQPNDVIPRAMEIFRWVDDDPNDAADTSRLAERFRQR